MAKVLVVTSGKGGVGKTTSTAALGAALARAGENVVVVLPTPPLPDVTTSTLLISKSPLLVSSAL